MSRTKWFLRQLRRETFFFVVFLIGLGMLFLAPRFQRKDASYGLSEVLQASAAFLESIVGMYYGAKLERRWQQRQRKVGPFFNFFEAAVDVFDMILQAERLVQSEQTDRGDYIFYLAQQRAEQILDSSPFTGRIFDEELQKMIEYSVRETFASLHSIFSAGGIREVDCEYLQDLVEKLQKLLSQLEHY